MSDGDRSAGADTATPSDGTQSAEDRPWREVAPLSPESQSESWTPPKPWTPRLATWTVWGLWLGSLVVGWLVWTGQGPWKWWAFRVDGLTAVTWVTATLFGGIVHSYARRYVVGTAGVTPFFRRLFAFVCCVCTLVAADAVALFAGAWLAMGLVMASLIGHGSTQSAGTADGSDDGRTGLAEVGQETPIETSRARSAGESRTARAAATLCRRYFLAGTGVLAVALVALWTATDAATISGTIATGVPDGRVRLLAVGGLVLAAAIQSALLPFHTWLLSSMTAPTPASALMHAGFVNAGGILLARFAPVVVTEPAVMAVIAALGAVSAIGGKLLKSVQPAIKARLGCSTVGQMGFMLVQAGLGFFGAAITHLALHGCYKAYLFLSSGGRVERTVPGGHGHAGTGGRGSAGASEHEQPSSGRSGATVGWAVAILAGLAGGVLFAALTGKGAGIIAGPLAVAGFPGFESVEPGETSGGVLLTVLVVVTTFDATRRVVGSGLPTVARYGVIVAVFLPSIALYGLVYTLFTGLMADLPVVTQPAVPSPVGWVIGVAFLLAYVGLASGRYRSARLYAWLVAVGQPAGKTVFADLSGRTGGTADGGDGKSTRRLERTDGGRTNDGRSGEAVQAGQSRETGEATAEEIDTLIERAGSAVGRAWPLHSFVTANPLSGFEDRPFHDAVHAGERLFGGRGYPAPATFERALADGRIDRRTLRSVLRAHGQDTKPEPPLGELASDDGVTPPTAGATPRVNRIVSRWLAAFLDEGDTKWPMPDRERGFYHAFESVARHDPGVPADAVEGLPDDPTTAIERTLAGVPESASERIVLFQLAALPGWTATVRHRSRDDGPWADAAPISLVGYLAVRLAVADALDTPIAPPEDLALPDLPGDDSGRADSPPESKNEATGSDSITREPPLAEAWLRGWEATYRGRLLAALTDESASLDTAATDDEPAAQLVFCIDTRSEVIRRHVERAGNYETHGYAGFFGVPMRYERYDDGVTVDARPPILSSEHRVRERVTDDERAVSHDRWHSLRRVGRRLVERLESNAATAFSYVESAGVGYGVGLVARTLLPGWTAAAVDAVRGRVPGVPAFATPVIDREAAERLRDDRRTTDTSHGPADDGQRSGTARDRSTLPTGMTVEERTEYAAAAFESMGWESFTRLVVFVGHASETANNPFDSSLDCGACAGNPGGPSARTLAAICNDPAVRERLAERGIDVPDDTVFLAGEHNTTTDEIRLFDADVPDSHREDLRRLRESLDTARAGAASERVGGLKPARRRAADWAETRPEWGLAGNAAFVVGPRELTDGLDLDGRAFLHSYDHRRDPDGETLAAILGGPGVVTQWINSQYYFATVDQSAYGSGSKVTQNAVGNVGVYQGNGGDLQTGLPLQSVTLAPGHPYHQPLRLTVVVHAPRETVTAALEAADEFRSLVERGWLSVAVVDPTHDAFLYDDGAWHTPVELDE